MRGVTVSAALLAALFAAGLAGAPVVAFAQQANAPAPAAAPAPGPGDTEELVIPPIVLEVEDLSVVHIEAQLPPEDELLPPALAIPLPEAGELRVGEPSLPIAGALDGQRTTAAAGPLSSQISLGAGSAANVSALVKLGTTGGSPVQLSFAHESLDGYGVHLAGSGFGSRSDLLDGSLHLAPGGADLGLGGSFSDGELGLQGHGGSYDSRSLRLLSGNAGVGGEPAEWLRLSAGVDGGAIWHTLADLSGGAPSSVQEFGVKPSLGATATFGRVEIGLTSAYGFHTGSFGPDHRFDAAATLGIELSSAWSMDGSVGWHWTSPDALGTSLSVFPFSVGLTGVIADVLTFTVRGGYRATPIDLAELMAARPLLAPMLTKDSTGWFGETSVSLGLARGIAANFGAAFATETAMLDLATLPPAVDPATGLFAVIQRPADRLTLQAGLRWNVTEWLMLNGSGSLQLLDRPAWEPAFSVNVEGSIMAASGAAGGRLSVGLEDGATGLEMPDIALGAFLRASPTVRLRLDALDILTLLFGPRIDLGPYQEPGFRVTAAAEIAL